MDATDQELNDVRAFLTYMAICGLAVLLAGLTITILRG
jgi:hypothetical protein